MTGYDALVLEFTRWKEAYLALEPQTQTQELMKKGYLEIIDRAIALVRANRDDQ